MNMRRKLNSTRFFSLIVLSLLIVSCKNGGSEHDHSSHVAVGNEYICPMRCEGDKTYAEPRNCPVCNMKLELVQHRLIQTLPPNKQVLSRQATTKIQPAGGDEAIMVPGYIVPAQNRNQNVAARFAGRVDKLYVKFNNQSVKKGDRIMDIYSPELAKIQEEHLFLLRSEGISPLLQRSRERLRLLGVTENQIDNLEKSGTVTLTVSVYSPANGYVLYDLSSVGESTSTSAPKAMDDSGEASMEREKNSTSGPVSQIREGMYVKEGQSIFSVNDLQEVWALVSIPHQYIKSLQSNDGVNLISEGDPSKRIEGRVLVMESTFEEAGQRFSKARILVRNEDNFFKINSLVRMPLSLTVDDKSMVPSSAVYKTGLNAYVWVKTDSTENGTGIFQLRSVIAGASNNGMTIIKSGLLPNEEIVLQAGLMADSETFLSEQ